MISKSPLNVLWQFKDLPSIPLWGLTILLRSLLGLYLISTKLSSPSWPRCPIRPLQKFPSSWAQMYKPTHPMICKYFRLHWILRNLGERRLKWFASVKKEQTNLSLNMWPCLFKIVFAVGFSAANPNCRGFSTALHPTRSFISSLGLLSFPSAPLFLSLLLIWTE